MKPFVPHLLPRDCLDWAELVPLIARANRAIARYDGIVQGLVNPSVLLSPLAVREAVLSSMIEGTRTTLEELLEFEADPKEDTGPRYDDIREVMNYRRAMSAAILELARRPRSLNLLLRMHFILMDSVRGRDQRRGEFRKEPNWIGPPNTPLETAIYVPPPYPALAELLDNFERYLHAEERDRLVQAALIHAQFELIHPFLDGNGRVGRMLVPLFLFAAEVISTPAFYMSAYLEAHRDEYYDRASQAVADRRRPGVGRLLPQGHDRAGRGRWREGTAHPCALRWDEGAGRGADALAVRYPGARCSV
ncbi:MAG: Fic family protein [Geminicoccaceae bacterium]